ncbi:MAG: hypothetical protein ACUVQ1_02465 [Candidatus Kapaibacteriales bacterium]
MNLPAITHLDKIFVPLKSFIQALTSIKFLDCTTSKDKVVIRLIKPTVVGQPNPLNQLSPSSSNYFKQGDSTQPEVFTSNISNTLPKFIQYSIDYFLLNPNNSSSKATQRIGVRKKDTTLNIPPKYYVLPPILKEK